jgi:predicted amidohydrolase YtcJ
MLDPYEGAFGRRHDRGIQFVDADALTQAVVALDARGFQVHQHALGDRAVRTALDAVEAARGANGWNDARHHVAHLQLPDPVDVPRLRRLGVVANLQPFWAQPDQMLTEITTTRVGERASRLYPIGSIRASGATLCCGSDWPVTTPNPWLEIEVAVTRRPPEEPDAEPLDAAQRIDLATAMAAFTRGSAYVNHDDEAGVIAPGMRADLAVLDRDPFDRSLGAIGETQVELTMASGRVVYER